MESEGGFHEIEKDGKLILVYHHPKYNPITPTYSSSTPLFIDPFVRMYKDYDPDNRFTTFRITSSPEYDLSTATTFDHSDVVRPLFWCNNKEFDVTGGCNICYGSYFGTHYYLCRDGEIYHKECVESPLKIKHPFHPDHSLQLYTHNNYMHIVLCICCGRRAKLLVYHCPICHIFMHPTCAMKQIPFVVDQPKRHDHPLTSFPRQACLDCNVCGLVRKHNPTYVCLKCNFVSHNDCMFSPRIIHISRHLHRVSYVSSLPSGDWSCGVCRRSMINKYGGYTCDKCVGYFVHSRCALRGDVCDGEELEGVEEDDITQDAGPFEMKSNGVILHFLHNHYLQLEVSTLYNENKLCQACALPIFEGNFYSCMKCNFILHESCANIPRRIQHALHPHPLTLKANCEYRNDSSFRCVSCRRWCGGFTYQCLINKCYFNLDVRCASVSEPFDYEGHHHPLFMSLDPEDKRICEVCKSECKNNPLNCIQCDFIVCLKCATLPYKARYKHDKHFLTLVWGEEVSQKDWCEMCERNLGDTSTKICYWCNICCTTLHVTCLFGEDLNLKPGQYLKVDNGTKIKILAKNNLSRPICNSCNKPCQNKIFTDDISIACSLRCAREVFKFRINLL